MADEEAEPEGGRCKRLWSQHWRGLLSFFIPIVFLPLMFLQPRLPFFCTYMLVCMCLFWITEIIPLPVTALAPMFFIPMMGINASDKTCLSYFKDSVFMFFGGLVMGMGIQNSGLHKRFTFALISMMGYKPSKVLLAITLMTMVMSMWIPNGVTTAIMAPVIKSILEIYSESGVIVAVQEGRIPGDPETDRPYPSRTVMCFYLTMAYTASLGGISTLMGSGTNIVFKQVYTGLYEPSELSFGAFMAFGVPITILGTVIIFFVMQWQLMGMGRPNSAAAAEITVTEENTEAVKKSMQDKREELGSMSCHEIQVLICFILMICLFLTRQPGFMRGWADIIDEKHIKGSAIVILVLIMLTTIPKQYAFCSYFICKHPKDDKETPALLGWKFINANMPWDMLLLVAGTYALTEGISISKLGEKFANAMETFNEMPPVVAQLIVILFGVFLTSFTSSLITCVLLVPIALKMTAVLEVHPLYLGLPLAAALSVGFCFPMSNQPNAIATGFANIPVVEMLKAGLLPTVIAILLVFVISQTVPHIVISGYTSPY